MTAAQDKKRLLLDFGWPLGVLLALTLVFRLSDLDLSFARTFYVDGAGWVDKDFWLWELLLEAGMIPGLLIGLGGLVCLAAGCRKPDLKRYRRASLFLVLLLLIGPGLLVNTVFKDNWGRPRPKQVVEFGGSLPFLPVWERGHAEEGKSFASGHAAIGFYTCAPFFVLRRRRQRAALLTLVAGTAYGLLMGVGRMAQGGHFASDVLWAWGFVFLSGMVLYHLLEPDRY